ncbi:nickel resistance protein [Alsobacter soli]|uniref:Nickel resistance protein n=1 Tax=Alsobacter soli TaxID=2109933 RepID=A0A2T1HWA1_9HYPH|nr:metal-sensing transcriptional repressor [Alsobacter soli]PSC05961.1 nickel resistance protein [Alsobacter soli]
MMHPSHPDIIARLKRAQGHLASVIGMVEAGRPCLDLAQQLHAVEKAVANAKRELIQDHINHCLEDAIGQGGRKAKEALAEVTAITKYL